MSLEGRAKLTEEEQAMIDSLKEAMEEVITELKHNGVRKANIEIELMWHIKNTLNKE
jgi:hypothetical protein